MSLRTGNPPGRPPALDVPISGVAYRAAQTLSDAFGGLSASDTARLLGLNKQTTLWIQRRALEKVRRELERG